jgi:hypothetical protein
MSAPYTNLRGGVLVGLEGTYASAAALADTTAVDVVRVKSLPDVVVDYAHDGERDMQEAGSVGMVRPVAKSGRFGTTTIEWQTAGAGTTYTAAKLPNGHRLFRIGGLTQTFGASLHDYTPSAEGSFASGTVRVYKRGMQYDLTGAYGSSLTCTADSGTVPIWSLALSGIMTSAPTQAAVPTFGAYTGTDLESLLVQSPKFEAGAVALFGATPIRVKSFNFAVERGVQARALDNSTGNHGGFTPDRRSVTMTLEIEQLILSTLNPRSLDAGATLGTFALTVGGTANNRFTISTAGSSLAVVRSVTDSDDGPTAMTQLTLQFYPSTPNANDEVRIRFD